LGKIKSDSAKSLFYNLGRLESGLDLNKTYELLTQIIRFSLRVIR